MADIFISYARADREKIEKLAAALEAEGYSVWWDRYIAGGAEYSKDIEKALNDAKVAVVAWSEDSIESTWVKDEAITARDQGKLIPISIDGAPSPMGFKQFHVIDLDRWNGAKDHAGLDDLRRAIAARLSGETPPPPSESGGKFFNRAARRARKLPTGVVITAIVALAIVAIVAIGDSDDNPPPPQAAERAGEALSASGVESASSAVAQNAAAPTAPAESIAVLPFADLSPDGDQEYFSDGIAEEILNALVRVDGLKVASRTSSFSFKGQEAIGMPVIARSLNVRHVLEGSVRKAGDTIRITAQLIDGETDQHMWSETYDRTLTVESLFGIQDEIAKAIVAELGVRIGSTPNVGAGESSITPWTDDLDAYELYLEALSLFQARASLDIADELLATALELDPEFARAWALRAALPVLARDYGFSGAPFEEMERRTLFFAEKALGLDPNSVRAVASIAHMKLRGIEMKAARYDIAEIIRDLEKAVAMDPADSSALNWLGLAHALVGEREIALEKFRLCEETDPFFGACAENLQDTLASLGRYDEARASFNAALARGATTSAWVNFSMLAYFEEKTTFMLISNQTDWLRGWRRHGELYELFRNKDAGNTKFVEDLRGFIRANNLDVDSGLSMLVVPIGLYEMTPTGPHMWGEYFSGYRNAPESKDYLRASGIFDYWRAHGFPPQCRPVGDDDFECD